MFRLLTYYPKPGPGKSAGPIFARMSEPVPEYDYLLVGGGAAGLSLAYHLAREPRLAGQRVLLIEPEAKSQNDRTWSYWATEPGPFDHLARGEWRRLAFRAPGFERVLELENYRYRTIQGIDFYRCVLAELAAKEQQFELVAGRAELLNETAAGVEVRLADGRRYRARYAFDSRPPTIEPRPAKYRYQLQHFVGWEVETEVDAFDPAVVEFMDFRGEQQQQARFLYVLPFGPRQALVEYTLFSAHPLPQAEYEVAIAGYLQHTKNLAPGQYRVAATEIGAIPMTDHPLPARTGERIVHLGTRGGRAKPSTGYAFQRIQAQSARLVAALAATGHPPADLTGDRWQFRFFDTLLLDIMQRRGESTRDVFRQLFERNPVERILRFLDEKTSWVDNFRVLNSVAPGPFLLSILHVLRGRPGRR